MRSILLPSLISSLLFSTSISASPISTSNDVKQEIFSKRRNFPPSPSGATLEQFQPCRSTSRTVPLFVNAAWTTDVLNPSTVTHAFIVQHGLGRDFNNAFSDVSDLIGTGRVLVAPNFYKKSDKDNESSNWYQPELNLGWKKSNSWVGGYDSEDADCSTYDVYDALTATFLRKDLYPALQKLTYIGHSDGGAFVSRYSLIADDVDGLTVRWVEANAPSHAYLTNNRPVDNDATDSCDGYNDWEYGVADGLPRYVADRFNDATSIFKRYVARDIISLTGDLDTYKNGPFGDTSCKAKVQGTIDRRDRNYAQWAYKNLLAGTDTDVSAYYGYDELKKSHGGVKSVHAQNFNNRNCVVSGVGHDAHAMFSSDCGKASLFDDDLPKGGPPDRPDTPYQTTIVEDED